MLANVIIGNVMYKLLMVRLAGGKEADEKGGEGGKTGKGGEGGAGYREGSGEGGGKKIFQTSSKR